MDSRERQNKMLEFIAALPDSVRLAFKARNDFDVLLALSDIGDKFELTIDEIHWLYEAVRRVLSGEDSPSNLVAFISEDERIEEDNRPKIPAIAQEIQRQIFDPVLPLLKQAGMAVKEGRVSPTAFSVERLAVSREGEGKSLPLRVLPLEKGELKPTSADSALNAKRYPPPGGLTASLDERHVRALARIAAGTTHTEEQLVEQFHTLPEGLKRAITTVDTANAIQEIAKKFLLHIDQMAALASETGLVLLGLTHPREFVKNLARRLRISEARALEIAREVSEQILGKVREALRGLHESSAIPNIEYRISKNQPQPSQIANQKTQEMPKRLGVLEEQKGEIPPASESGLPLQNPPPRGLGTSFNKGGMGELPPTSADSPLNATRYPPAGGLNASSTPYSPNARWETGEASNQRPTTNNQQQTETEEKLTREEVLRDIESPNLNAKRYPPPPAGGGGLTASPVGPTGWRPPESKSQITNHKSQTNSNIQNQKIPKPTTPPSIPPLGKGEEGNVGFLEQKLAGPTGAAHTEKRYTIDPYREPLG